MTRKALIGWWVDGYWCPTRKIRDHWQAKRVQQRVNRVVATMSAKEEK